MSQLTSSVNSHEEKRRFPSKRKLLLVIIIITAAGLLAFNVNRVNNDVVTVFGAKVTKKHMVERVPAWGTVVACDKEVVFSQVTGTVKKIDVILGQKVNAGQVLIELDIPNGSQQIAEAELELTKAQSALSHAKGAGKTQQLIDTEYAKTNTEINYQQAEEKLDRCKELYNAGAISRSEYETTIHEYEKAQAAFLKASDDLSGARQAESLYLKSLADAVTSALTRLTLVKEQNNQAGMRCKHSGYIGSISVKPGDLVTNTTPLMTVVNKEMNVIRADVPEAEAWKIAAGQTVKISGIAMGEQKYQGQVIEVGMELIKKTTNQEGENNYLPVVVALEKSGILLPGCTVDLEITTREEDDALVIPVEALAENEAGNAVWIIQKGLARMVPIQTGINDGITVQAIGDIKEGDKVILNPSNQLKNESRVKEQ